MTRDAHRSQDAFARGLNEDLIEGIRIILNI